MDHSMETVSRGGGGCSILGLLLFPPVCDHSSMPPPLQIEDVARFVTEQIPRPYRPTLRMSSFTSVVRHWIHSPVLWYSTEHRCGCIGMDAVKAPSQ